jgi:hypothetical protein
MERRLAVVCAAMLAVLVFSSVSIAVNMNLMTGREKGTYYQFGLNLQQLVKPKGWEQYDCVRKYLVKKGPPPPAVKPAGEINPILEAVKEMLNR